MRASVILALVLALTTSARADERPWASGISAERQESALAVFKRANDSFAQNDYTTAVQLYREAIAQWNHPAILGNLAVALVQLDQPVQAYLALEAAFAYGAAPFDPTVYSQLQTAWKLLSAQIARIEVTGDTADATVLLDGAQLGSTAPTVVKAGAHELVARRTGFLTFSDRVDAPAEQTTTIQVTLVPLEQAGELVRRFPRWQPYAVLATGGALALVGLGFELAAIGNVDDYESEIAIACPAGCAESELSDAVRGLRRRARWQNIVGITGLALGGAAIATGAVMLYLNQPYRRRVDESGRPVAFVPMLAPDLAGAAVVGSF